jgi:hypothetical protein
MLNRRVCVAVTIISCAAALLDSGARTNAQNPDAAAAQGRTAPDRKSSAKRPAFSPDRFLRVFRLNKEETRQRALQDVERYHLDDPKLPDALWEVIQTDLKSKRLSDSLLRAIAIHGRLKYDKAAERQLSLLAAAPPPVAIVVLQNLVLPQLGPALADLSKLTARPEFRASYPLRHALVSAVGEFQDLGAIDLLVQLQSKFDGQLRFETSRRLANLTGEDFGGKAADWENWWSENKGQFQFAARRDTTVNTTTGYEPIAWDYVLPKFYGVPVYAKRVVFVIDHSGSMKSSVDGITRLEEAQKELEGAIKLLPEDAWFDVIAYNVDLTPWQGRLMQAVPLAKSDAVRFSTSLYPERKTAIFDALIEGVTHEDNLELVLFLSDGQPTAGKIVDRTAIIQAVTAVNVYRRVSINTIGIDARGPSELFLQELASQNFGTYRSIR